MIEVFAGIILAILVLFIAAVLLAGALAALAIVVAVFGLPVVWLLELAKKSSKSF